MPGRFGKPDATGRSSGVIPGRAGKASRPPQNEPWIWLTREVMESHAWRSLGINARRFVDRLLIEHMNHAGQENGRLKATYEQLEAYGLSKNCTAAAISETESAGLVEAFRGGLRVATEYRLTWLSADGAEPTNEWKRIGKRRRTPLPPGDIERTPRNGGRIYPQK
jgi:hypothetical protein